jgi:hypothetical protein
MQQRQQQHEQRHAQQQHGGHSDQGRLASSYVARLGSSRRWLAGLSTPDLLQLLQGAGRSTARGPAEPDTALLTAACEELHARRVAQVLAAAQGGQQGQGAIGQTRGRPALCI